MLQIMMNEFKRFSLSVKVKWRRDTYLNHNILARMKSQTNIKWMTRENQLVYLLSQPTHHNKHERNALFISWNIIWLHLKLLTFKFIEKFRFLCYIVASIFIFRIDRYRQQFIGHWIWMAFAVSIVECDGH